jgi:hypothetical protein
VLIVQGNCYVLWLLQGASWLEDGGQASCQLNLLEDISLITSKFLARKEAIDRNSSQVIEPGCRIRVISWLK